MLSGRVRLHSELYAYSERTMLHSKRVRLYSERVRLCSKRMRLYRTLSR